MYVKVTRGGGMGGDFIAEAHPPIYSGSASIRYTLGADNDVLGELGRVLGEQMYVGRENLEGSGPRFDCPPLPHGHGENDEPPFISWSQGHVLALEAHTFVSVDQVGREFTHEELGNWWAEGDEDSKGFMNVKYAWWQDEPHLKSTVVVTTRNIFLVGENGKTIDRVR